MVTHTLAVLCRCCIFQAIKSIEKNGIDAMAKEAGIDLWKLPYEDARPQRKQYLAENKGKVPVVRSTANERDNRISDTAEMWTGRG